MLRGAPSRILSRKCTPSSRREPDVSADVFNFKAWRCQGDVRAQKTSSRTRNFSSGTPATQGLAMKDLSTSARQCSEPTMLSTQGL